jgi:hypothetical protein
VNIFGNNKRLDAIEGPLAGLTSQSMAYHLRFDDVISVIETTLAGTNDLVLSCNEAIDRIDCQIETLNDLACDCRNDISAGQPVIERDALGRVSGGGSRIAIRQAFVEMGLVRVPGSLPAHWAVPVRADTDLKAELDRRYTNRHERHKVKRSQRIADVEEVDLPF